MGFRISDERDRDRPEEFICDRVRRRSGNGHHTRRGIGRDLEKTFQRPRHRSELRGTRFGKRGERERHARWAYLFVRREEELVEPRGGAVEDACGRAGRTGFGDVLRFRYATRREVRKILPSELRLRPLP